MARGFTRIEGIDYEETFAPTAKFVTIRLIVALATILGWPLDQADVDTAFLWADIKEDIYMQQPKGHVDPEYPDYVEKNVEVPLRPKTSRSFVEPIAQQDA